MTRSRMCGTALIARGSRSRCQRSRLGTEGLVHNLATDAPAAVGRHDRPDGRGLCRAPGIAGGTQPTSLARGKRSDSPCRFALHGAWIPAFPAGMTGGSERLLHEKR
jgi:hypothetical protein